MSETHGLGVYCLFDDCAELKSRSLVRMQLLLVVSVLLVLPSGLRLANSRQVELLDDNDFAEFEESDDGQLYNVYFSSLS